MHAKRFVLAIATTFLGLTLYAQATNLDKKQARELQGLERLITNTEKALEPYQSGKRPFNERINAEFASKLERMEKSLAEFPADNDDVQKTKAHLDAFKAAYASKAGALAAEKKGKADAAGAIDALLTSPECDDDVTKLKAMRAMFAEAASYAFTHYHFDRWPDHDTQIAMRAWGEGWAATQQAFAAMTTKYAPVLTYKGMIHGHGAFTQIALKEALGPDGQEDFATFKSAVAAFVQGAPGQVAKETEALKAAMATATAKREFKAFTSWDGSVVNRLYRIQNIGNGYLPLAPSDADRQAMTRSMESAQTLVDGGTATLADALVKENRAPLDTYKGGDRAAIEAKVRSVWKDKFPSETILTIRLAAEAFSRRTSWSYDSAARAWRKTDESYLPVRVIVKHGATEAVIWYCTMTKDHMRGDSLFLGWMGHTGGAPSPLQRMLVSNL